MKHYFIKGGLDLEFVEMMSSNTPLHIRFQKRMRQYGRQCEFSKEGSDIAVILNYINAFYSKYLNNALLIKKIKNSRIFIIIFQ